MKSVSNIPLYTHSYLVATPKGYTKHYYTGEQRICSKLGKGGLDNNGTSLMKENILLSDNATSLLNQTFTRIPEMDYQYWGQEQIESEDLDCIMSISGDLFKEKPGFSGLSQSGGSGGGAIPVDPSKTYGYVPVAKIQNLNVYTEPDLLKTLGDYGSAQGTENEAYYYHSDHLGSASWITDVSGLPLQHLQYLPYGEPFVNQRTTGYSERFTFTGKERDEELRSIREHDKNEKNNSEQTGYSYYGARFLDSDLGVMWLSVDPLSDKYPSTSPYMYCLGNPIKLVDPNGEDVEIVRDDKNKKISVNANFYYNRDMLGSDPTAIISGFSEALGSWENDIKTSFNESGLGDYTFDMNLTLIETTNNPEEMAMNDPKGNSILHDENRGYGASVKDSKKLKANMNNALLDKKVFFGTGEIQGTAKHEIGHFFGLRDRAKGFSDHAPYIESDLMSYDMNTRNNGTEPFKRVLNAAGLNNPGNRTVIINKNNKEKK